MPIYALIPSLFMSLFLGSKSVYLTYERPMAIAISLACLITFDEWLQTVPKSVDLSINCLNLFLDSLKALRIELDQLVLDRFDRLLLSLNLLTIDDSRNKEKRHWIALFLESTENSQLHRCNLLDFLTVLVLILSGKHICMSLRDDSDQEIQQQSDVEDRTQKEEQPLLLIIATKRRVKFTQGSQERYVPLLQIWLQEPVVEVKVFKVDIFSLNDQIASEQYAVPHSTECIGKEEHTDQEDHNEVPHLIDARDDHPHKPTELFEDL